MEGGLPMLNCLLQHTLRSLCLCSDSSKWVYAVFWRILPRNYPPPKWDHGGGLLDRAKGNKRNWILVWEDGFCDFFECERGASGFGKRRFGADIFFKMTHEVYNFGEGLVGKVASDNTHKWVFRDSPTELDPSFVSSWNVSIDPQPRAWEAQFSSGIETIAIISVREGAIQLGSFDKVVEDLNMVLSIRRKFSYLQSIPGIYTMQRPYQSIQTPNNFDYSNGLRLVQRNGIDDKQQVMGLKRQNYEQNDDLPTKSIFLGYNSPQNGISEAVVPLCSMTIPPLLPSVPWNLGSVCSKNIPSVLMPYYDHDSALVNNHCSSLKSGPGDDCVAMFGEIRAVDVKDEEGCKEGADPFAAALGFEPHNRGAEKCCES